MFHEEKLCRLCQDQQLMVLLDLGAQPPANSNYLPSENSPKDIPLRLAICVSCKVTQIVETVSPKYLFSEYQWKSGTGQATRDFAVMLPGLLKKKLDLDSFSLLEIASNDGTFLEAFKPFCTKLLGVDPAHNLIDECAAKGLEVINDFFSESSATKILETHGEFDVVLARNVIPHVPSFDDIASGVKKLLAPKGFYVIEFHSAYNIHKELQYDSIYHEHIFYFSLTTLSRQMWRLGFYFVDSFESPLSGGATVAIFSLDGTNSKASCVELDAEKNLGIDAVPAWEQFAARVASHAEELCSLLNSLRDEKKIVAYGASARASTLLNFCHLDSHVVEFIVDNNPNKVGRKTPGTNIDIVSYKHFLDSVSSYSIVLLTAWNFAEEICNQLRRDGYLGKVIIPFPTPTVKHIS